VVLLERRGELAAIRGALGTGGVVVIEGGAGIGKTSLLAAAAEDAEAAGYQVLRARASELESDFAFGVVLQLFERPLARMSPDDADALFAGPAGAARRLLTGGIIAGADAEV
jgi:predicted ATPase